MDKWYVMTATQYSYECLSFVLPLKYIFNNCDENTLQTHSKMPMLRRKSFTAGASCFSFEDNILYLYGLLSSVLALFFFSLMFPMLL